MARALILLAFATCLGCAVAQDAANASNTSFVIVPSTTLAPSSSATPNFTSIAAPNATSAAPNASSVTPNATSVAPNASTPAPTSHSPAPTPTPILPEEKWNLTNAKNMTCVLMEAKIQLEVTYPYNDSNKIVERKLILDVEGQVDKTGPFKSDCKVAVNMSLLTVRFDHGSTNTYYLSFTFQQLKDSTWNMTMVHFFFPIANNSDFNGLVNATMYNASGEASLAKTLYRSDHNMSYVCNSNEDEMLDTTGMLDSFKVKMTTSDLHVQAFSFKKNGQFGTGKECSADHKHKSSDNKIVPIAVGAALAGLVIIVLIAYLIGRFRSRKHKSYETLS